MAKRTEAGINDGIFWRIDDIVTAAQQAAKAHEDLVDSRYEVVNNEQVLASGSEDLEDAEYAASLRDNVAEQRERLAKAHAARVKALEDAVSCAQHALALVKFRDPKATDSLGEQPEGGDTGLVWVGAHYI